MCLNDSMEFTYAVEIARPLALEMINNCTDEQEKNGYRMISSLLEERNIGQFRSYIVSFSEEGDLLSQWRGYTRAGDGYAIEFNPDILEQLIRTNILENKEFYLAKCRYVLNEQKKIVEEVLENARKISKTEVEAGIPIYAAIVKNFLIPFLFIAPLIKHPTFKQEQEWRLIAFLADATNILQFKPGKSMLIPYISFKFDETGLPFNKIILGPNPHPELNRRVVLELLDKYGATNAVCTSSSIPYRDW